MLYEAESVGCRAGWAVEPSWLCDGDIDYTYDPSRDWLETAYSRLFFYCIKREVVL